ncbi:MAG: TlyA family RNA methyltransferase, partial [Clostridia bacterium]|nr:TlyA family RNA methyltransferase [Clostridia bacterium]
MSETQRLDAALVSRGLVSGREKAKELIAAGQVQVNGLTVTKATRQVGETDTLLCDASSLKYVGRGGFKLEKALELSGLSLAGAVAMDVGASTGGFTDCMLQNGASRVFSVDVGHDQLHSRLREDPRVVCLEGTDVRNADKLCKAVPLASLDLATVDVSFISLNRVVPAILPFLKPDATLICLIKPQFEAGKEAIGKNGLVKDARVHKRILTAYLREFSEWDIPVKLLTFSPITGGEGNIEYLAVADRSSRAA